MRITLKKPCDSEESKIFRISVEWSGVNIFVLCINYTVNYRKDYSLNTKLLSFHGCVGP